MSSKVLKNIPQTLKEIKNPVKKLHFKGNSDLLTKQKVSIVGSRKPLNYTKEMISMLAKKLSQNGIVIVSGAAMGIDIIAHKNAMPNTIAVMANSLDVRYPAVNSKIIQEIEDDALVISEYEPTTKATNYSFVIRNRIVVALSNIIIIAEADLNSGSMRSAELAIEQGKSIYVLPHRMDESLGTQKLLKNGTAKAIYDANEFISDIIGKKIEDEKNRDVFLKYCMKNRDYEEVLKYYPNELFSYELEGKIKVENMKIIVL